MRLAPIRRLLIALVIVTLPLAAHAQEATFAGTVTDSTGGVLPGVTITGGAHASGNTFTTVTDERGEFRLPVRVGNYTITAELSGFTTVNRSLQILIGQTTPVDVQMAPSTVQETVTVTGEAPLVDATGSTVGTNIDPRQMQELPINGRNWMDLTLLAPGARRNEGGGMVQFRQGYSQTNVDGQQLTVNYHSQTDTEQVGFSRDAIAEFSVVANRFDATMGRSSGMIVNAVTKSGTNTFAGTFGGYFRHDNLNAKDFIEDRVLPYSNQQVSATFGGPIRRDRIHFFGAYEYEREPKTFYYTSPYPSFNVDVDVPEPRAQDDGARRLSVHAADAPGGARLGLQQSLLCAWRDRQRDDPPVGGRHPGTHRTAVQRHLYAGARQPGGERDPGRRHRLRAAGCAERELAGRSDPLPHPCCKGRRRSSSCAAM